MRSRRQESIRRSGREHIWHISVFSIRVLKRMQLYRAGRRVLMKLGLHSRVDGLSARVEEKIATQSVVRASPLTA